MRKLIFYSLVLIVIISCKKEKDPIGEIHEKHNFMPLAIGNYWVYQDYDIDSAGYETMTSRIDSVIINRDTIIRNQKYFVLEGIYFPGPREWRIVKILRDSSGYLVNEKGSILFSESNFEDTLYFNILIHDEDTIYTSYYMMDPVYNDVEVPAGKFNGLNYRGTLYQKYPNHYFPNPRFINSYYAEDVGEVIYTYFYLASNYITEKRLIRYHIIN